MPESRYTDHAFINSVFPFSGSGPKVKLTRTLDESLPLITLDINHMDRALRYVLEDALRFVPKKGAITRVIAYSSQNIEQIAVLARTS